MFNFEKLEAWQHAIALADSTCRVTRHFPAEERFGLTNQMRRAAVSVSSNLAEGSLRSSRIDFARFVEISTGSVFELISETFIAKRQATLPGDDFEPRYALAERRGRIASGLRNSLLNSCQALRPFSINHQPSTINLPCLRASSFSN